MTELSAPESGPQTGTYEIRVKGLLDRRWAASFDGLALTHGAYGTTVIRGPVADQAALHGLLFAFYPPLFEGDYITGSGAALVAPPGADFVLDPGLVVVGIGNGLILLPTLADHRRGGLSGGCTSSRWRR